MLATGYWLLAADCTGEPMTLAQVFDEMGMTPYDLSIDALGMHTDTNTFCRFDKFNLKALTTNYPLPTTH